MSATNLNRQEEFYARVRHRTAERWKKKYISRNNNDKEDEEARKTLARLASKAESPYNLSNVMWLLTSIGVFYISDIAAVIFYDNKINRVWMYAGISCLIMAGLCAFYCIVYLSWIKKINSDRWEQHNPFVIPAATISMVVGTVLICVTLWPVYNVLTLPIVVSQIMGLVVLVALVPDI